MTSPKTISCWAILTLLASTPCALGDSPFVAGFDRLGKHGDIALRDAGRLLIAELSCVACHASADSQLAPKKGPVLDAVGSRVHRSWLRDFLISPQKVKPGTTMPDALAGLTSRQRTEAARALVAFLSEQRKPFPVIKATGANPVPFEFWNKGNAQHGRRLFHQIGCVACHAPDQQYDVPNIKPSPLDQLLKRLDPEELKELGLSSAARRVNSIPLPKMADKYTLESLTHFLIQPESIRDSGRMPNFDLKAMDAAHISAYLIGRTPGSAKKQTASATDQQLVNKGRSLFTSLGCVHCHRLAGTKPVTTATPLSRLAATSEKACWTTATRQKGRPHFPLTQLQKKAVAQALTGVVQPTTAERLQAKLVQLNCFACHERKKLGGVGRFRRAYFETVGSIDIGDEGRLPPQLDNVGSKMPVPWLERVLAGKSSTRPHMHIRMPRFPSAQVRSLSKQFAAADHPTPQSSESKVFGKDLASLADAGRALMNLGCVQCHPFRGEALPGTVGIDLQGVTKRVQPAWFRTFLLNPAQLKPRTRMPTFFPNGKSQVPGILNGKTEQQVAAMWAYLRELDRQPLPEKIATSRAQNYELTPKKRPVVLRTFMRVAGTHAIAVGFPQKVHYAFDAENVSLAAIWRGRFLDAQGTWFVRAAPPADPLGKDLLQLPRGAAFATLPRPDAPWPEKRATSISFRGYRLNAKGLPTLRYSIGAIDVVDRPTAANGRVLKRTLVFTPGPQTPKRTLWFRLQRAKGLVRQSKTAVRDEGVVVSVRINDSVTDHLRSAGKLKERLLSWEQSQAQTIEVEYRW